MRYRPRPRGGSASLSSLLIRFEQSQRSQQLLAAGAAIVTVAAVAIRVRPLEVLPAMLVLCTGLSVAGTCDALWRLLPKRVVYPTWLFGSVGLLSGGSKLGTVGCLSRRPNYGRRSIHLFLAAPPGFSGVGM